MKKLNLFALILGAFFAMTALSAATYIGADKCKMCHVKQHQEFAKMKHATALSSLKGENAKKAECLKCHTTGYGQGGYDKDPVKFANVQCESCHGAGSDHMTAPKDKKKATIQKSVSCTVCHNPHISYKALYGTK